LVGKDGAVGGQKKVLQAVAKADTLGFNKRGIAMYSEIVCAGVAVGLAASASRTFLIYIARAIVAGLKGSTPPDNPME